MTFTEFLDSRNIDQQTLTKELAAALVKQWQSESVPMVHSPPATVLLIPDDIEERWSRAIRLEVGT